jgi:hypothetical protein
MYADSGYNYLIRTLTISILKSHSVFRELPVILVKDT